jgi:hypothetical protein
MSQGLLPSLKKGPIDETDVTATTGANVIIFSIFSPKGLTKIMANLTQNTAKIDHNIGYQENHVLLCSRTSINSS